MAKAGKKYIYLCAAALLLLSSCAKKENQANAGAGLLPEEHETKAVDVPQSLEECGDYAKEISVGKADIIRLQDEGGNAFLSQISMFEIRDDYIGLSDRDKLYCYGLPSGKLIGKLSAKGQGPEEYISITSAAMGRDKTFSVLISKWQNASSEIKVYGNDGAFIKNLELPGFYGDLYAMDSTSYVLAGAVNSSGGCMPLVKYSDHGGLDTIFIGERVDPRATFFQARRIFRSQPSEYFIESGDSVYVFNPDRPEEMRPSIAMDYKGMKYDTKSNRPIHESLDNGIMPTSINAFGDCVWSRYEKDRKIYYSIYDAKEGRVAYGMKVDPRNGKFGLSFNANGVEFCSWPIAMWKESLLFPVPDDAMSEIFGADSNPGLLKMPQERLMQSLSE